MGAARLACVRGRESLRRVVVGGAVVAFARYRAAQAAGEAPVATAAAAGPTEAADQANTPLPIRTQIEFKPAYTFASGSTRYKTELLFNPILPYRAFLIPGLEVDGFWSVARIQWTGVGVEDGKGPSSGLTDLTLTDVVAHRLGPVNAALGFVGVLPMATEATLGQGKLQLGPAAAVRLENVPALKLAVLVQNFYSVAGSSQSPELAYMTVQPFVTMHLPADLFLSSDATMKLYWEGGESTVPVNLGFGHAFGAHFVGSARAFRTIAGADRDAVKVEIVLDFEPEPP
jgi:hypothetical protein